jgi:ABC-type transporter Mla subunit MlaD
MTAAQRKESVKDLMDNQQQQRLNEAADQFSSALVESFRVISARTETAQERGTQLTEDFFNRVISNLRAQAEDAREMTQQLADQHQRAQEAGRTLTQESANAYKEFVNSMFSFWQGGIEATKRAQRRSR